MGLRLNRVDAVTFGVLAITAVFTGAVYAQLPPVIATHFDASGNPNGWMPREIGAWFGVGLGFVTWLFVRFAGYLSPAEKRKRLESAPVAGLGLLIAGFICVVQALLLWVAVTPGANITRPIVIAMGGLALGLGVMIPRFPPNPIVGVRTFHTLTNTEVWEKTSKLTGRTFLGAGVVMILAGLVGGPTALLVAIVALVAASVAPMLYAMLVARRT